MTECDCGATNDGKWAGIHSKECAFIKARTNDRIVGFQEGLDAAANYLERFESYGGEFKAAATEIRNIRIEEAVQS